MAVQHIHKADTYLVTFTVEPYDCNMRVDHFLKSKYRKLSRERIKKAIKDGRVLINQEPAKPARITQIGDRVSLLKEKGDEPEVDFNFQVLFEDEDILVVDKPGNLPCHPSGRYFFNTLLTQLRVINENEVDEGQEHYIVHRLDRETSGVMVLGKSNEMATNLQKQFFDRKTKKEYLAIARGRLAEKHYDIAAPLARDPNSEITLKMHVVEFGPDGQPLYLPPNAVLASKTIIDVEDYFGDYTLVRCKPHTGRQHQIRIHLDSIGHPIAGDKLYGQESHVFLNNIKKITPLEVEPGLVLTRHALHAARLQFAHPRTGKALDFQAELPSELKDFLQKVSSRK